MSQSRRPSILIAHPDPLWVDQAKQLLERMGYEVTQCPEMSWAADLLTGSRVFDLAAISSEIDPNAQAQILRAIKKRKHPPKLLILLDNLDSATINFRADSLVTYRVANEDVRGFVKAVAEQLSAPPK